MQIREVANLLREQIDIALWFHYTLRTITSQYHIDYDALLIMRLSIYIYTCFIAQIAYQKRGLLLLPYLRGALWTFIT